MHWLEIDWRCDCKCHSEPTPTFSHTVTGKGGVIFVREGMSYNGIKGPTIIEDI